MKVIFPYMMVINIAVETLNLNVGIIKPNL